MVPHTHFDRSEHPELVLAHVTQVRRVKLHCTGAGEGLTSNNTCTPFYPIHLPRPCLATCPSACPSRKRKKKLWRCGRSSMHSKLRCGCPQTGHRSRFMTARRSRLVCHTTAIFWQAPLRMLSLATPLRPGIMSREGKYAAYARWPACKSASLACSCLLGVQVFAVAQLGNFHGGGVVYPLVF